MPLPWLPSTVHAHTVTALNVDGEYDQDSDDESYYEGDEDEEETLGSQDTDIDDDEVQDLEADAEMPPKKTPPKSASAKKSSGTPKKDTANQPSLQDLTADLSKMSLTKLKPNFTYELPFVPFDYKENNKHVIEFHASYPSIPIERLKYCRVLPGGRQVALLVLFPRWATGKKLLALQMGKSYSQDSARVQAHAQQVTHYVTTNHPEKDGIMGDPQVIDLPFRCVEGEVETNFFYSPVEMPKLKGQKHSHQQFAIFINFKVQSAEDYKEEFSSKAKEEFLGTFQESDDDEFGTMDG